MVDRIDPDYDPEEDEFESVAKLLARSKGRMAVFHYKDGNGFQKWVLGLVMLLVVAGIAGLATVEYTVVQRLSVLETKVDILLVRK